MEATITGGRIYSVDFPQGDLELPASFTCKSRENVLNKMEQLVGKATDE